MSFRFAGPSYTSSPFTFGLASTTMPEASNEESADATVPVQEHRDSPTSTVKFNVGGKIHEIPRSLLEEFPGTLLQTMACGWPSPCGPIFISRDPDRFAYCLDYMRDNGNVFLPETVSKAALLSDLKFLGFVNVDEAKIKAEKSQQNCIDRFHEVSEHCKQRIEQLENEKKDLEKRAKALELDRKRKNEEIELEKVILMCLGKSVQKACEKIFTVSYSETGLRYVERNKYFVDRCSKLGLHVVEKPNNLSSSTTVVFKRKTKTKGRH